MEDDLKEKWKTTLKQKNGKQPKKNRRRPKKNEMEDNLKEKWKTTSSTINKINLNWL